MNKEYKKIIKKKIKPNKEHIVKLLTFLEHQVLSEGGDGDAIWFTKLYSLEDIRKIIEQYNDDWGLVWVVEDGTTNRYFNWGIDQEWITITDDEKYFNSSPDWITIKIQH